MYACSLFQVEIKLLLYPSPWLIILSVHLFFLTIAFLMASVDAAQSAIRIFIDQVDAYSLLYSCAEREVSTIVRNMENGCGDEQRSTSYECFCSQSSTEYDGLIRAKVATACTNDITQVRAAAHVFGKYCDLGKVQAGMDALAAGWCLDADAT